ncbi:MAG: DUF3089 domain-containing protein [Oscillospiraceae bacterium]|nr:DUF3089 domain-containing protein [Oscillospiraceae bacterium]
MKKVIGTMIASILIAVCFAGCGQRLEIPDYSDRGNWAYYETENCQKAVDVFFVCPTVYGGSESQYNMSLSDSESKASFLGAINMEKGIYDADGRFFAPYYRQAGLQVYTMPVKDQETYLKAAYLDVKAAFEYYMEHCNDGRPIVLAGFSQGADHCIRLMKDCFADEETRELLVACYAIGWRLTEGEIEEYPHLKFAQGEQDTGVIVSFNSESEQIDDSLMIPSGTKTLAINPLNWKCDGTIAYREQNMGACFTDYEGNMIREVPHFTGAYIDMERGALKLPDVAPEDYPAGLSIFEDGVYHIYDYQFFYRNLQENVQVRIKAFMD